MGVRDSAPLNVRQERKCVLQQNNYTPYKRVSLPCILYLSLSLSTLEFNLLRLQLYSWKANLTADTILLTVRTFLYLFKCVVLLNIANKGYVH
jgi:hypothetical protein